VATWRNLLQKGRRRARVPDESGSPKKGGKRGGRGVVDVGGEALLARNSVSRSDAVVLYAASRHVEGVRVN
jgi:hypothetical protein